MPARIKRVNLVDENERFTHRTGNTGASLPCNATWKATTLPRSPIFRAWTPAACAVGSGNPKGMAGGHSWGARCRGGRRGFPARRRRSFVAGWPVNAGTAAAPRPGVKSSRSGLELAQVRAAVQLCPAGCARITARRAQSVFGKSPKYDFRSEAMLNSAQKLHFLPRTARFLGVLLTFQTRSQRNERLALAPEITAWIFRHCKTPSAAGVTYLGISSPNFIGSGAFGRRLAMVLEPFPQAGRCRVTCQPANTSDWNGEARLSL
ncbi:MAG: hypothetical protein JWR69_2627 [Pedosphaera sp.]|nr:hypothetical protein [Pedosphaera sp.]